MGDGEFPAEDEGGEMSGVEQDPDSDVAHAKSMSPRQARVRAMTKPGGGRNVRQCRLSTALFSLTIFVERQPMGRCENP